MVYRHATAEPASQDPPASKLQPRSVHVAVAFCIVMTLLTVAGNLWALQGQALPKPASLVLPAATVFLYLTLSWSVNRGYTKAFRVLILLAAVAYFFCLAEFSWGNIVRKVLGQVQPWIAFVAIALLLYIHWYFVDVLYEYAVQLAEEEKKREQGEAKGEGQV